MDRVGDALHLICIYYDLNLKKLALIFVGNLSVSRSLDRVSDFFGQLLNLLICIRHLWKLYIDNTVQIVIDVFCNSHNQGHYKYEQTLCVFYYTVMLTIVL